MDASHSDHVFMRRALELASKGLGYVEPNPMVGCVIVCDDKIVGQGFHERFGGNHAEIQALLSCENPSGATVYVTLEPCCHFGKTPPCVDALIRAQVKRVVVAMTDPFEKVSGGGIARLQEAGIETRIGVLQQEALELNAAYLKRIQTGRPFCIAKWAMTVDGRIATHTGESQWITSQAARSDVHQLRSRVDAIAVGMGTVFCDDPTLTARLSGDLAVARVATRVVYCLNRLPSINSNLVKTVREAPVLLVVSSEIESTRYRDLVERGVSLFQCQSSDRIEMIGESLDYLGSLGMTNLMIEGGAELTSSFMDASEVDQCDVYIGGKVFGGRCSLGPVGGEGISKVIDATTFDLRAITRLDDTDVKLTYRRQDIVR